MYLYSKLQSLNKDISICFIGCGKFISMFLSQYNQLQKIKISAIVDINIGKAKLNCRKSGLNQKTIDSINFTNSLNDILKQNIDVFIEATGDTIIGTEHGVKLINNKKNLVVNE
jgi:homoserine dehydrogenase